MLPDVNLAFSRLLVPHEPSQKRMSSRFSVVTAGGVEIGCAAKVAQDTLVGSIWTVVDLLMNRSACDTAKQMSTRMH